MDREDLEHFLAEGMSLAEIGARVGRSPSTVSYWLNKHGLEPVNRERYASRGGIDRLTLERLISDGLSLRAIARELNLGLSTVRHWVKKYDLVTPRMQRLEESNAAREAGERRANLHCFRHGLTEFRADRSGRFRCVRCASYQVTERRRRVKSILIEEAGGSCACCGYDKYAGALQFHHLLPDEKGFMVSNRGVTLGIDRVRREAEKCVLLCANCHAEVEAGVRAVNPDGPARTG